jgi:Ca2+-transporting ATPase
LLGEDEVRKSGGLGETEAAERLRRDGPNELPSARARGLGAIALDVVTEPMTGLLVACSAVYLALGDRTEALILLVSVVAVVGISLRQTAKAERALGALRELSSPRALVIRDGREQRIAGRDVVRDDLVILSEGDRVPADAVVLWQSNLRVDESLLTGEAIPVGKASTTEPDPHVRPGGDDSPVVYSGSLVVSGHGIARVRATGARTELGRIGAALGSIETGETALQREVERFVRVLATLGAVVCVVVVVVYGLRTQAWLPALLAGLALAMSMVPEELPVILTLFLALGAWRISRRNVLVRRMPALDALGATTVLCVDKTGTLTQNRMTVTMLSTDGGRLELADDGAALPEPFHPLVEFAVLASQERPFDPMERAINELGDTRLRGTEHIHRDWTLVREYPLSPQLLAMSHVWRSTAGEGWIVAAKGAPEAIVDLCHLPAAEGDGIAAEVNALAAAGLRVLGVASVRFTGATLPTEQHDFPFAFLGLLGLADPVRPGVPGAVADCASAGIRTIMITGDYAVTAQNVAARIGLARPDDVVTGPDLTALDDAALAQRVADVSVFARMVPEQKLRLVRALQSRGEVVAMTGDGVNDAPALQAADVGVAMGLRGTDTAREAADLVVADDDFTSITAAIRAGRRVYDNIAKAMAYAMAVHVPIAATALVPVLLGWPLVLLPVHIVFLELVIDPACSIVFEAEPEEVDVMRRRPRPHGAPLFSRRTVLEIVLEGTLATLVVCATLALAVARGYDDAGMRMLAFPTLVLTNLALIFAHRSTSRGLLAGLRVPNPALWLVVGAAVLALGVGLAVPAARAVLGFAPAAPLDVAIIVGAGVTALVGFRALGAAIAC